MTPPRRRLRFSTRTLLLLVTIVAAYLACWWPTKKWGVEQVLEETFCVSGLAVAPLVVQASSLDVYFGYREPLVAENQYYFWFFGFVAKLPYED